MSRTDGPRGEVLSGTHPKLPRAVVVLKVLE